MSPRPDKKILDAQAVVAEKIQALPDNFLDCRDPGLRHAWMRETDFHVTKTTQVGRKVAEMARIEVCGRCETRKVERFVLGRYGIEKIGQHYDYPEGYLLNGTGAPRGVKRSTVVWGENYRRAQQRAVEDTAKVVKTEKAKKRAS